MILAETTCGKIQGVSKDGVTRWLGIPYAEAPVGEYRFKKTVKKKPWDGVLVADHFGNRCPYIPLPVGVPSSTPVSEDCLYLNIWAKDDDKKGKPVFVWIHGGGLKGGEGSESVYDGAAFVSREDIITVTFNYRLGILGGFVNLKPFPGMGEKYDSNTGLYDIIEAIRWIHENIEAFGGDPEKITVGGESAGAMFTSMLLVIPEATKHFQRAILQSLAYTVLTPKEDTRIAKQILEALGLTPNTASKILEIPGEDLMSAIQQADWLGTTSGCSLIECELIAKSPLQLLEEQGGVNIPCIIGTNHDEGSLFAPPADDPKPFENPEFTGIIHSEEITNIEKIKESYSPLTHENFVQMTTDRGFVYPTIKTAEIQTKNGKTVFVYRFDYVTKKAAKLGLGCFHSFDLPFVFDNLHDPMAQLIFDEIDTAEPIAQEMQHRWACFMRGENPGWEPYNSATGNFLCLDIKTEEKTGYGAGVLEIWDCCN